MRVEGKTGSCAGVAWRQSDRPSLRSETFRLPPDIASGLWLRLSIRSSRFSKSVAKDLEFGLSMTGMRMLSLAVSSGIKLKAWNTGPIRSRRNRVSAVSLKAERSLASTFTVPESTSVRPTIAWRRVLFPEPEATKMATNSPDWIFRSMRSNARTSEDHWLNVLTTESMTSGWSFSMVAGMVVLDLESDTHAKAQHVVVALLIEGFQGIAEIVVQIACGNRPFTSRGIKETQGE